jgi:RND family efflux transporter MFP subunit
MNFNINRKGRKGLTKLLDFASFAVKNKTEVNMREYISLFIIWILFIVWFSSCSSKEDTGKSETKINVEVATVVQKSLAIPINTSGKLYTSTESKLSFKIPGIIANIHAEEGQMLKKGSLLASLDLVEMKAKVNQAQSAQQKAQRDLERAQRLYADSVVTLEQLQNAKTALEIASSDVKVAEFNLRHSTIYAPESGKILKRFAEEGELIGAGNPVFLYGANKEGWVLRAGVTDRQIVQLQVGDKAIITFDAYPDRTFEAKVSAIEAVANPYTGTFEVEVQLEQNNVHLFSGFVGKITIIPGIAREYSVIPIESLVEGDLNEGYIYSADRKSNIATKHKIKIDKIIGNQMLIYSGLEGITEVVTYGAPYLTAEAMIEIME